MSTEKEKRIFREKKKLLSKLAMILCAVHNKCVKRNWLSMSCFDCLMLFCLFLFLFSGSTVCDSFRNKHVYFKNRFNYCKEQKIPLLGSYSHSPASWYQHMLHANTGTHFYECIWNCFFHFLLEYKGNSLSRF